MSKKTNNCYGFSLIEVMIASGLMLTIGFASLSFITQQLSMVEQLDSKLEKIDLVRNLENVLSSGDMCTSSFGGLKLPKIKGSMNIANLKDNLGKTIFKSNTSKGGIEIGQIKLTNVSINKPNSRGLVEFVVPLKKVKGLDMRTFSTNFNASVDKNMMILDCTSKALPKLSCISVVETFVGESTIKSVASKVARCPADYMVTGCAANCRGSTLDYDTSLNSADRSCSSSDTLCSSSGIPQIQVFASCCKVE